MKIKTKYCKECGDPFTAKFQKKYCSDRCKELAYIDLKVSRQLNIKYKDEYDRFQNA